MMKDEIRCGVALAADEAGLKPSEIDSVAGAIASNALFDVEGRQALRLDRSAGGLVSYDLFKGVVAAAGVLGATIAAATGPMSWPAVLAALAALGSLQGIRKALPRSSARIAAILLNQEDRRMARDKLGLAFANAYDGPANAMEADLNRGLDALEEIKAVKQEQGVVRLVERVIFRF
jgi:hypothetical protein